MTPQEMAAELRQQNKHEAAALIETLTADLATAGEQLRVMREALVLINETMPKGNECRIAELSNTALALTPAAAEEQARANAEKAKRAEDYLANSARSTTLLRRLEEHVKTLEKRIANQRKELQLFNDRARENAELAAQVPGLAEQVGAMREAIEHLIERRILEHWTDSTSLEVCYSWCPLCKLQSVLALTATAAEAKAAENAAKAANAPDPELLTWAEQNYVALKWTPYTTSGQWWYRLQDSVIGFKGRFETVNEALRAAKAATEKGGE